MTSRPTLLAAAALALAVPLPALAAKKAPPVQPATQYPASDTHPKEHLTVAADPCTDEKNCPFFRLPYIRHSFIPIRVVFTNDGDQPLSLEDVRIQFIAADKTVLPAANDDDLQRRLFTFKSVAGRNVPLPAPLPSIRVHGTPVDKKILDDEKDFGFPGTALAPHSTLGGYLFYDVRDLDRDPLQDAEIYIKEVKGKDGKQLFAFTIPLNKWLTSQPKPAEPAPAPKPSPAPDTPAPTGKPDSLP